MRGKSGCPKCAKANGNVPAEGTRQQHPTFAKAKHALLQHWDHDQNRENGSYLRTRHYAVTSSLGANAMNDQRARCTAGKLAQ